MGDTKIGDIGAGDVRGRGIGVGRELGWGTPGQWTLGWGNDVAVGGHQGREQWSGERWWGANWGGGELEWGGHQDKGHQGGGGDEEGGTAVRDARVGGPGIGVGSQWRPPHSSPLVPLPPEPSDRDLSCLLASLVQLLADPHARTLHGFQSLVQREWVAAGHPFPQRLGLRRDSPREEVETPNPSPASPPGDATPHHLPGGDTRVIPPPSNPPQSPVFLLFLDCTWQLLRQFPAAFGFTEAYLLALHDSTFLPYCSTFLFSCQRQKGRGGAVSGVACLTFPLSASVSLSCLSFPIPTPPVSLSVPQFPPLLPQFSPHLFPLSCPIAHLG